MKYTSIKEEWPFEHDLVWVRFTIDGVIYKEEMIHPDRIIEIDCLGIPEWRALDPPGWADGLNIQEIL